MSPRDDTVPMPRRLARSVLASNLGLRKGEAVAIEGWSATLPWAVAMAREARRLGAHPVLIYEDEASFWDSVDRGEDKVLGAAPAHEWAMIGKTDVFVHFWGPNDRQRLAELPAKRRERIQGFNDRWYRAARKAHLRGARMEIGRPSPGLAKLYGVDEEGWRDQVVAATIVEPRTLRASSAPIVRALERGKRVRIRADNGTDLTVGLSGRKVAMRDGTVPPKDRGSAFGMLTNLPSGQVRVALDETVADGTLVANRSCYYDGGKADGAVFRFADGRLTEAKFDSGGELFDEGFKTGGKGRDRPGILSVGLNPGLRNTPQVEDVEAGAVLISVGGNRFLGGKNASTLFGFAIHAGATLEVDGKEIPLPASG